MSFRSQLQKFNQRGAQFIMDYATTEGCLMGPDVAHAVPVTARVDKSTLKQEAGEGGFEFTQAPRANILKADNPRPRQDWCFYDGEKWWLIDDSQTTETSAEWNLILKPLTSSQK